MSESRKANNFDGRTTSGEGVLLETQSGRDVLALIKPGVPVEVSSFGKGSTREELREGKITQIVESGFDSMASIWSAMVLLAGQRSTLANLRNSENFLR